jgi:hypothetical protein
MSKLRSETYGNPTPVTRELLDRLREIANKSSHMVAWYPHRYEGQVRGGFCRWFECTEGGGWDKSKASPIADVADDVEYCAAAMNHMPALLDYIDQLRAELHAIVEAKQDRCAGSSGVLS